MLKHGNPERGLRRMNELGLLAAFIPEFAPIVAMMQFNMYHHYTVDEHTIQCISHLSQIERNELEEELPIASGILEKGVNRKVLYVALLLHDIGKGRSEDHSILGAYAATRDVLENGLEDLNRDTLETEAKRALRSALPDWSEGARRKEVGRHYGPYWQGLPGPTHVIFAKLLAELGDSDMAVDLVLDADRDATRACFVMQDHRKGAPATFAADDHQNAQGRGRCT